MKALPTKADGFFFRRAKTACSRWRVTESVIWGHPPFRPGGNRGHPPFRPRVGRARRSDLNSGTPTELHRTVIRVIRGHPPFRPERHSGTPTERPQFGDTHPAVPLRPYSPERAACDSPGQRPGFVALMISPPGRAAESARTNWRGVRLCRHLRAAGLLGGRVTRAHSPCYHPAHHLRSAPTYVTSSLSRPMAAAWRAGL